jgi:hypothetical protein
VDHHKIDGALSIRLESGASQTERIPVFLRTPEHLPKNAVNHLVQLGIEPASGRSVFAADLSKEQVSILSDQVWVTSIRLARQARSFALR